MKFNAYQRYQFTGDLYRQVPDTNDPNGGTIPIFDREVKLHFANDPDSIRSIALTDELVEVGDSITDIADKTGLRFMGRTQYTVTRVTPVFNVWQNFECYQLTLAISEYGLVFRAV